MFLQSCFQFLLSMVVMVIIGVVTYETMPQQSVVQFLIVSKLYHSSLGGEWFRSTDL